MGTKNCPESPRQKMINMMYLVLTAMLALNVAAETLEAFKIVDASLIKTYLSFTDKNQSIINDFNRAYKISPNKVEKWRDSATEVHIKSDSLIKYIIDTKEKLVLGAGGKVKDPLEELNEKFPFIITNNKDTLILERQDDLNISPEIMDTKHRGDTLQAKIIEYKNILKSMVEAYPHIIENIQTSLDVEDPDREEMKLGNDKYRTWVQKNFLATPVIASITLLSKLQIDIRNAESAVLRHLYNQIDAASFKMTGLRATVIPDASYIFQGQEYRARIFLSAEDTTQDLEVFVNGSTNALMLKSNEAIYTFKPSEIGPSSYNGVIRYRSPDGGINNISFQEEYQVAKPAVTVAPTRMNVLFKNLKNPVSLSASGIPYNKLYPEFNNGKMYKDGDNWIIEPDVLDYNGDNTSVKIYADFDGEKRFMGEMPFRVMKVPDPIAKVANISSGGINRDVIRVQNIVSAKMENFYFDLSFIVTGFTMTVPGSGGLTTSLPSNSYSFTPDQKKLLNSLGAGDRVLIENIRAKIEGVDNDPERPLPAISLTVQ